MDWQKLHRLVWCSSSWFWAPDSPSQSWSCLHWGNPLDHELQPPDWYCWSENCPWDIYQGESANRRHSWGGSNGIASWGRYTFVTFNLKLKAVLSIDVLDVRLQEQSYLRPTPMIAQQKTIAYLYLSYFIVDLPFSTQVWRLHATF